MEAIEATYFDTCEVWRLENVAQPNGSKKQQRVRVYAGIACALSMGNRPALNTITKGSYDMDEVVNKIQTQDKLYLNPSYLVKQGDEIIITSQGRTLTAQAGLPFLYDSHQELVVEDVRYA
jgi:hypothetical protein